MVVLQTQIALWKHKFWKQCDYGPGTDEIQSPNFQAISKVHYTNYLCVTFSNLGNGSVGLSQIRQCWPGQNGQNCGRNKHSIAHFATCLSNSQMLIYVRIDHGTSAL